MDCWAIHIDMEGFSVLWEKEDQILLSLGELMSAIFRLGSKCFPDSPERLFAYQLGDGFLITSNFREENLERAVTVAVALMKHVAASGRLTKAALAEGELSDIQGCYPKEVLDSLESDHTVSLKMGIMTIFPVMGTALIRSVKVAKASPKGPVLTIEKSKVHRLPKEVPLMVTKCPEIMSIDWVNMDSPLLKEIQACSGLASPTPEDLKNMLSMYCVEHKPPQEWVENAHVYLGVPL